MPRQLLEVEGLLVRTLFNAGRSSNREDRTSQNILDEAEYQRSIKNAAFMAVSLEELQEIINEEGYTVEYQNGANQSGTKQSDAVKTHIAMTKNHAAIIKQLCDLVPPEKKKESRLQALRDE